MEQQLSRELEAPPVTIGDVLEQVGMFSANEPLDDKDVKAIESAEALATGSPTGVHGGPASEAKSAVQHDKDSPVAREKQPTLGDVLHDCKARLPVDKVVTEQDAKKVMNVEGELRPGHVAAAMAEAATYNKSLESLASKGM